MRIDAAARPRISSARGRHATPRVPTATPTPGGGVDSDGDGCSDIEERGHNHELGGERDPSDEWDFFDVPAGALTSSQRNGQRNKVVSLQDVGAVLFYVGTVNDGGSNNHGVDYDTDYNANGREDGSEYDRQPSRFRNRPWLSRAPNGTVSLQDVGVALAQVGDSCVAPP